LARAPGAPGCGTHSDAAGRLRIRPRDQRKRAGHGVSAATSWIGGLLSANRVSWLRIIAVGFTPLYLPETPSMLCRAHALLLSLLLLLTAAAADEPKERSFTDGSKAGPDFLIQGEYEGKIGENTVAGLQVIALGDGKFDAVMYAKGLPGSGADKTRVPLKGETKDGITTFTGM